MTMKVWIIYMRVYRDNFIIMPLTWIKMAVLTQHQLLLKLRFVLGEINVRKLNEVCTNIVCISYSYFWYFLPFYDGIIFCLSCSNLFCFVIVLIVIFWLNEVLLFFGIYHFYYRIIGLILVIFSCMFVDCF